MSKMKFKSNIPGVMEETVIYPEEFRMANLLTYIRTLVMMKDDNVPDKVASEEKISH